MHLQLKSRPFISLLTPFIPQQLAAMESEPATTMATVVKWRDRKVTIDGSGILANAIFLRLEREFPSDATYETMAGQLRKDEEDLFGILGVEEIDCERVSAGSELRNSLGGIRATTQVPSLPGEAHSPADARGRNAIREP